MFEQYRVIHFVGIGGIGMSGIAEVLHNLGYEVTGSDARESETTRRLRELGIPVHIGHGEENVGAAHVVVVSSAVSGGNAEVLAARRQSVPVIPRAEMLAELARLKYSILIAGAHGKTTTTSLIASVLGNGGLDPTIIIGGKLKSIGTNARLGTGQFLVAEADESDGSFLKLSPTIAVVTNIDREHMEFFKDLHTLKSAFLSFIDKIPFYGVALICIENEHLREIVPSVHRRYETYGLSPAADLSATNIEKGFLSSSFDVLRKGKEIGRFTIPIPGQHNVLNALACIGVALELQMDVPMIREALAAFSGIQRRFEFRGEGRGVRVYDDYGHHPTEIRATLAAARETLRYLGQSSRLFVVFQPHRFSRTSDLMEEFVGSFDAADVLVLLDIYPAGERPIEGVSTATLFQKIRDRGLPGDVVAAERGEAAEIVAGRARRGDMVITLGAGDVWKVGEEILGRLRAAES